MECTVLLFGPLAQATQRSAISVRLAAEAPTVADLRRALAEGEPQLAALVRGCRIAVNHEFAREDRVLRAQDEVAVIGMVSGG